MKTIKTISLLALITVIISLLSFFSYPKSTRDDTSLLQDTASLYRNGIYEGMSQHIYKDEPFWGKARIRIENGKITVVSFSIRDSSLHEDFDQKYEKHFDTIPEYVKQCRNDWNGVRTYPGRLLKSQDLSKVDAISGATWSYNIFRAAVDSALKKAVK